MYSACRIRSNDGKPQQVNNQPAFGNYQQQSVLNQLNQPSLLNSHQFESRPAPGLNGLQKQSPQVILDSGPKSLPNVQHPVGVNAITYPGPTYPPQWSNNRAVAGNPMWEGIPQKPRGGALKMDLWNKESNANLQSHNFASSLIKSQEHPKWKDHLAGVDNFHEVRQKLLSIRKSLDQLKSKGNGKFNVPLNIKLGKMLQSGTLESQSRSQEVNSFQNERNDLRNQQQVEVRNHEVADNNKMEKVDENLGRVENSVVESNSDSQQKVVAQIEHPRSDHEDRDEHDRDMNVDHISQPGMLPVIVETATKKRQVRLKSKLHNDKAQIQNGADEKDYVAREVPHENVNKEIFIDSHSDEKPEMKNLGDERGEIIDKKLAEGKIENGEEEDDDPSRQE